MIVRTNQCPINGSPAISSIAVAAFKIWVDRKKIQWVEVSEDKQGRKVLLKGITHNKLISIIDKLGLSKPKPKTKTKTKPKTKPRSRKSGREKRQQSPI
jgi:hypothetical protein